MGTEISSHSPWPSRATRRGFLRGAGATVGVAVLGAVVGGCTGARPRHSPATGSRPTAASPKKGGHVVICFPGQMVDLSPHVVTGTGTLLVTTVYDHLFLADYVHGNYELFLAQSLENPDPLTYIFKIKPSARFQNLPPVNGRNVTAQDVVASWQAFVANPRAANKNLFANYVDHYETPDPATLIVRLKKPNAWAIGPHGFAALYPGVVAPKELVEGKLLERVALGSGPFVLDRFDPASEASFVRRPDGWYIPERPYVDRITCRVIADAATRAAAFKAKQLTQLAAQDKVQAEEFKGYSPDIEIDRDLATTGVLLMRADENGFFRDVRVREAVYNALDLRELIDQVFLGEAELSGPVPPFLANWALPVDEIRRSFPHDLKKARDLLAAAGWDPAREVELKYPSRPTAGQLAELLQEQLAAAGIKTRLLPEDMQTVWASQTLPNRNFQLAAVEVQAPASDPDMYLRVATTEGIGGGNTCRWSDPEVDEIVARQSTEFDPQKQRALIFEAQRLILKKFSPSVYLFAPYSLAGRWRYYHPALASERGHVSSFGHYAWVDTDDPSYPRQ